MLLSPHFLKSPRVWSWEFSGEGSRPPEQQMYCFNGCTRSGHTFWERSHSQRKNIWNHTVHIMKTLKQNMREMNRNVENPYSFPSICNGYRRVRHIMVIVQVLGEPYWNTEIGEKCPAIIAYHKSAIDPMTNHIYHIHLCFCFANISMFSHGFPMVFLWFSYGFPLVSMVSTAQERPKSGDVGHGLSTGPESWTPATAEWRWSHLYGILLTWSL